jgi:hypothetical protein
LLSNYRTRVSPRRATAGTAAEPQLARDLRQSLSGDGWKSMLCPRWVRSRVTSLLLLGGTVFLLQLGLAGLVLFLESLERQGGPGTTLREKHMLSVLVSCAAGWCVAVMELVAVFFRDRSDLWEFARRPVSPGQLWKQFQLQGTRFIPAQVLLAVPFVALTAAVAPSHTMNSCFAVLVALLACFAVRTALCAGSCYFSSIANLRAWVTFILATVGMGVGFALIGGAAVSGMATCANLDWTPGEKSLALALQQIATLAALGIAWRIWYAVGSRAQERTSCPTVVHGVSEIGGGPGDRNLRGE